MIAVVRPVHAIRHLLAQRHLAVLICASALLLKLLVPTGYMIANEAGRLTVTICSGVVSTAMPMTMSGMDADMAAMHGTMPDHDGSKKHGKVEMPCAYAGLSAQVLGAVDPVLLTTALAYVATNALLTAPRPALKPAPHLRPPSRGPPLSLN